jgi:hypothetical protein
MADASPSRHVVYASTISRPALGSSSRAGSRDAISVRHVGARPAEVAVDAESTSVLVGGGDESTSAVNFGMSPLPQRQVHVARAVASPSPQSKAPVSVQDRIRQLNGGRYGR